MTGEGFEAPGAGSWELETAHFARPVTRFFAAAFVAGFPRGFAEGTARYGAPLDYVRPAIVNGFVYSQPVIFGADGAATPKEIQARVATSVRAFEEQRWRADLDEWDTVDRPAAVAANRVIQRVDPAALSDDELAGHVGRCRDHLEAMLYLHGKYNFAAFAAVGDYLVAGQDWTGASLGELMAPLRGTSPISTGFAAELEALAGAIRASSTATQVLTAPTPSDQTLSALITDLDVGADTRAYLDTVRFRSVGYDVGDATVGEMPELLVEAIRAAVAGAAAAPPDQAPLAALRARVPPERVADFEQRLAEARLVNRLREERGAYTDGWATGLARRTLLEAGRRLHVTGQLAEPAHALDLDAPELAALLRKEPGPSTDEAAARYHWRTCSTVDDAPPFLGDIPKPPPPVDALPPQARRAVRAFTAGTEHVDTPNTETVLHGLAVNAGIHEGTARLVEDAADFGRIRPGDILVARVTSPYFNVVLPLLGAIVTDRGGQLCHAAIVAREYGIPGIVGTRDATRRIHDGARIRVDGTTGEVRLLW